MSTPDISQLSAAQQEALQTYTGVTDQDPIAAISLLQRCEWNVQIAIARFFDGEPVIDPLAEARAAQSVPPPTSRETTNLQYESLISARPPRRPEHAVDRVDTTASTTPAYRVPFLFTPFTILFRLYSTVLSPISFLVPSFLSRIIRNILTIDSRPSRRQLPPADTAHRFIREFEETYTPNPPLPFVPSGFNLTMDNCKKESKFMLVVLLSPSHDETHGWVRDTLLSSQVHQFLQTHQREIILWGGSVQDSEGYQVSGVLNCTKFPFAALICETSEGSGRPGDMTVVMRAAGPMPAAELVAKLGSAMTTQQAQLAATRAQRADQQASRSLRQEQDSAYERSLAQDRERAQRKREEEQAREQAEKAAREAAEKEQTRLQNKDQWRRWRAANLSPEPASTSDVVRLSIRLADGDRVIRKFNGSAPLEDLYAFVECYDLLTDSPSEKSPEKPSGYDHRFEFQLVSPMPRTIVDLQKGGTIIERVGRGGTLVVEELDTTEDVDT